MARFTRSDDLRGAEFVGVVDKDIAPEDAIPRGDPGGVGEAFAGQGERLLVLDRHQRRRDRMGEMADVADERVGGAGEAGGAGDSGRSAASYAAIVDGRREAGDRGRGSDKR